MGYYHTARPAVAANMPRRNTPHLLQFLVGAVLALLAMPGNAGDIQPAIAFAPAARALAKMTEPDLMEAAFREGIALYQAGDYTAAARTLLAPAMNGHAGAQFSLGVAYATGHGVTQSLAEAIRWWNKAAARGHVTAQLNLGLLYWRGVGVEKDLTKAREWWRRAADGGDAVAQFHLGAMAAMGEGIPLDYAEAVHWWRLSAAQGYEQAIKGLRILESSGLAAEQSR